MTEQLDQEKEQQKIRDATGWEMFRHRTTGVHFGLGRFRVSGLGQTVYRSMFPLSSDALIALMPHHVNSLGLGIQQDVKTAWADSEMTLEQIVAKSKESNIQIAFMMLPYQFMISQNPDDNPHEFNKGNFSVDPGTKLAEIFASQDTPFSDLTPAFQNARKQMSSGNRPFNRLYQPHDYVHPNAAGYKIVADEALKFFLESIKWQLSSQWFYIFNW